MGYVLPYSEAEYNPAIPQLEYDLDFTIPWWDLEFTHQWMLDKRHCETAVEDIWAVRLNFTKNPKGLKIAGEVSPLFEIVTNPFLPDLEYEIDYISPYYDLGYEHIWMLDNLHCETALEPIWAVKISYTKNVQGSKVVGSISPIFQIELNPLLPNLEYEIDYTIPYHDLGYEHVWMLHSKHCETAPEDIWAVKISATNKIEGTKIIGEVSPLLNVEYNPSLPQLEYDIDYTIPYHDLGYEHLWLLDKIHCETASTDIWAVKISATNKIEGTKIIGEVSPVFHVEYNPELPIMDYNIDYVVPYHDLGYEHVWMLDEKHCETAPEDIWAVKISAAKTPTETKIVSSVSPVIKYKINKDVEGYNFELPTPILQYYDFSYIHRWILDKQFSGHYSIWAIDAYFVDNPVGEKDAGYISPRQKIVYNKDLKNIHKIELDYKIPYHDRRYEHLWYLNKKFTSGEKIWAAKLLATKLPKGTKEMGEVIPVLPDHLDVFFISYYEPNAEKNWKRVQEKAPWAKRINGVKGIFEAHKTAAKQSSTDMFYVVDGDAWLVDDWKFDYQPGIFDRDSAYVWLSENPINGLIYGYGGVKLFSKIQFLKTKTWKTLDMTTGIMPKLKVMDKISNVTAFDTDEYSTWKSAFRECVKLEYNSSIDPENFQHLERLATWKTIKGNSKYGKIALEAAQQAEDFFKQNKNKKSAIFKINDTDWLRNKYNTLYKANNCV
jgi:hypothetical protein